MKRIDEARNGNDRGAGLGNIPSEYVGVDAGMNALLRPMLYGAWHPIANLDRLAERGITFVNALTPSPVCAPARACLASGMTYEQCRVPSNRENYPLDLPTYYQALRDAGYRVAGVGKFALADMHWVTITIGLWLVALAVSWFLIRPAISDASEDAIKKSVKDWRGDTYRV